MPNRRLWKHEAGISVERDTPPKMPDFLLKAYEIGSCLAWAAAILSVPFWIYVIVYEAPKAELVAQQQKQDAIARDSRAFCAKYGLPIGSSRNQQCVDDLAKMWGKQEQQLADDLDGFF